MLQKQSMHIMTTAFECKLFGKAMQYMVTNTHHVSQQTTDSLLSAAESKQYTRDTQQKTKVRNESTDRSES